MKWSHLTGFRLLQIQSGQRPFVYCIEILYIQSIVVFGSWLGSYHKYGSLPAISQTNIDRYSYSAYCTDIVCLSPIFTEVIA
jgi:hypothetical protein